VESVPMEEMMRLPLHTQHAQRGAKFGQFGRWEVPLYYSSILEEHDAVRTRAGVFDISHMGEFLISGVGAGVFLNELLPRDISRMQHQRAWYMPLLNEGGGILDDIILYRFREDLFLMIVNAANIEKDFTWVSYCEKELIDVSVQPVKISNVSEGKGLLAIQGPQSAKIVGKLYGEDGGNLKYYHCKVFKWGMLARTGYTGEDGFEIMVDVQKMKSVWAQLFEVGEEFGLVPTGFGARDTLRLEAGMFLYGHDMDENTSPLAAGIGWAVDLKKSSFIGRSALLKEQKDSHPLRLMGFEMVDRGIPRQGCKIKDKGQDVGHVTSGSFSPTLKKNIGLGYVDCELSKVGTNIDIMIRNQPVKARVCEMPFYRRKK